MHEDSILVCALHQRIIDGIRLQQLLAPRRIRLAHGDPCIGDHAIGSGHCLLCIRGDREVGAVVTHPVDDRLVRLQ